MSDRKFLYTERAHYMCPNMHFGIMAEIGAEFDANRIIASVEAVRSAHSLMRSLIAEEQGSAGIYEDLAEYHVHRIPRMGVDECVTDYPDLLCIVSHLSPRSLKTCLIFAYSEVLSCPVITGCLYFVTSTVWYCSKKQLCLFV